MKLSLLYESISPRRFFHGVSVKGSDQRTNGALIKTINRLLATGFYPGAYFTQNIGIALAYRRDIENNELNPTDDHHLRGILEINEPQEAYSIDGDYVQHVNPSSSPLFRKLPQDLQRKWSLIYLVNNDAEWDDSDYTTHPEWYKLFPNDDDIYSASQDLADEMMNHGLVLDTSNHTSGNIKINKGVDPSDIIGAYVFTIDDGYPPIATCTTVLRRGSINLNQRVQVLERTSAEH